MWALRPRAPIQMNLGDGRILQVEAVTFGIQHQSGTDSVLKRFRPWLPGMLVNYFSVDRGANRITMNRPGLVVWVNAIKETGRTNVDCQGIHMEFVDRNGDVFSASTSSWFASPGFWRVGHIFYCYPREEKELQLRVTTWKKGDTVSATLRNPHPTKLVEWSANPLPLIKTSGDFEITLHTLSVRTNRQGTKAKNGFISRYLEPNVTVLSHGNPTAGWNSPEWVAESANGNRGQFLGVHHDSLRFEVTTYPSATNLSATPAVLSLPEVDLGKMTTNLWWSMTNADPANPIVALGVFQSGTHSFSEGEYQSSSLTVSGPHGGAPSGWTGNTRQVTPLKKVTISNHYTPTPVIYLRTPATARELFAGAGDAGKPAVDRLALRLRDAAGNYWIAEPDKEINGISPFRLKLPPDVTRVVPEIILLKPLKAEFLVNTKNIPAP